jgi:hypothetical protein
LHDRKANLPHLGSAEYGQRLAFCFRKGREQQGSKNCDNRNHHEKFNQREAATPFAAMPDAPDLALRADIPQIAITVPLRAFRESLLRGVH